MRTLAVAWIFLWVMSGLSARADENWTIKFFCSSACSEAFETTTAAYLSQRVAELNLDRIEGDAHAKAVEVVLYYHMPGGSTVNIYYVDPEKYPMSVLYQRADKGKPGCWRIRKYDRGATMLYVASYAFRGFSEDSLQWRDCLDMIVQDALPRG